MGKKIYSCPDEFHGKLPMLHAAALGLQHVLSMFAGNLIPVLIITDICSEMENGGDLILLQTDLLQNSMLISGIVTLIQLYTIGPIGGKVPLMMGNNTKFAGLLHSITGLTGGGVVAYATILGASIIGGTFEMILGFLIKPLRKLFPSVVTGTIVLAIGVSFIPVSVDFLGGGSKAPDFGSPENLMIGMSVIVLIIAFRHLSRGIMRNCCVLAGILSGYILCLILSHFTADFIVTSDGVTCFKSWIVNFNGLSDTELVSVPAIMPISPVFDSNIIIPILIYYMVSTAETIGDISGVVKSGLKREATDRELSGGVICDGAGSLLGTLFGVVSNTSCSQNIGLTVMTGVVNRYALTAGAVFLIICGFSPRLAVFISTIPECVIGGAAVIISASIIVSGIQLISENRLTGRNITIIVVALGLGFGISTNAEILNSFPVDFQMLFSGSGIVPVTVLSVLFNIILPSEDRMNE